MHLVLRSSKARGEWSFKRPKNEKAIQEITAKFAFKYGVQIISMANVGNHLHFHIKLTKRYGYKPFIRAITAAIMMKITGISRWTHSPKGKRMKFLEKDDLQRNKSVRKNQSSDLNLGNVRLHNNMFHKLGDENEFVYDLYYVSKGNSEPVDKSVFKFWDHRPFTRVILGFKALLTLKDYITLNNLEGSGVKRHYGTWIVRNQGRDWAEWFIKTAPG